MADLELLEREALLDQQVQLALQDHEENLDKLAELVLQGNKVLVERPDVLVLQDHQVHKVKLVHVENEDQLEPQEHVERQEEMVNQDLLVSVVLLDPLDHKVGYLLLYIQPFPKISSHRSLGANISVCPSPVT